MSLRSLIIPSIVALGAIGAAAVAEIFKESDIVSKSKAVELAEKNMSDESRMVLKTVDEAIKKSDKVFKSEQTKLKLELGDWAKATGLEEKILGIKAMRAEEAKKIESDFNFDAKKADIVADMDKKLANFKEQIGYSERMTTLQNEIDSAKSMYDMQKQTLKLTTSDDNLYQELKKTAKRVKNTSVENAERELKAVQSRVNEKIAMLDADKARKIESLRKDLDNQISSAVKKYDTELEKLTSEKISKANQLRNDIVAARSSENSEIVNTAKDLSDRAEEIQKANKMVAEDIFNEMPRAQRLGNYFSAKKWPKVGVIVVSILPLIPVGYVVYKYFGFVKGILSAM